MVYFRFMNDDLVKVNALSLQLITTDDGSHTLFVPELNEHYHSTYGAIAESMHVFIQAGFLYAAAGKEEVRLLEVGMGTGLNAMLTFVEAEKNQKKLFYTGIEPFPLPTAMLLNLNYALQNGDKRSALWWKRIHEEVKWNEIHSFSEQYVITKWEGVFEDFPLPLSQKFNLIYFDAFAPSVQPQLWEAMVFERLAEMIDKGGVLVSYSSKGAFRRNLANAGFYVEKIPGPIGKREMVRGIKL